MESVTSAKAGRLHCHKFDRWLDVGDAACAQPDDYCEQRERCGIYFLMSELNGSKKKRKKEGSNQCPCMNINVKGATILLKP
jgi:hypothetical protein